MRIWIAPWEDSRGDLHAPGYLYTEIEPRRWTLGAPAEPDREFLIRPLQIERRDTKPDPARPGRERDTPSTPDKAKTPEAGPNLLGS
jgi:conjugal transfer pilus assembly protein TraV